MSPQIILVPVPLTKITKYHIFSDNGVRNGVSQCWYAQRSIWWIGVEGQPSVLFERRDLTETIPTALRKCKCAEFDTVVAMLNW